VHTLCVCEKALNVRFAELCKHAGGLPMESCITADQMPARVPVQRGGERPGVFGASIMAALESTFVERLHCAELILTMNRNGEFFMESWASHKSRNHILFSPCISAPWSSGHHPPKCAHFQDHILTLHTDRELLIFSVDMCLKLCHGAPT
jgi:hypothetical protein